MNATEFRNAVAKTRPGGSIVYHTGDLAYDTSSRYTPLGGQEQINLRECSKLALTLSDKGAVMLVQRRRGYCEFDYIAVVCKRRRV
jgi:hypothetical protein